MEYGTETRLREHPERRFAGSVEHLDFEHEVLLLAQESASGQHGHRQKALIHEGPMTIALYLFDAGSTLPDHVVDGVVLIDVLKGRITVSTDHTEHDLPTGHALRLLRGVRHDVAAVESSQVLLFVALEGPDSHP